MIAHAVTRRLPSAAVCHLPSNTIQVGTQIDSRVGLLLGWRRKSRHLVLDSDGALRQPGNFAFQCSMLVKPPLGKPTIVVQSAFEGKAAVMPAALFYNDWLERPFPGCMLLSIGISPDWARRLTAFLSFRVATLWILLRALIFP